MINSPYTQFELFPNAAVKASELRQRRYLLKDLTLSVEHIIVSTIVLKELEFKLGDKFNLVKEFFKDNNFIKIIKTTSEDYELARNYEDSDKCGISFYDYLHVAIAKRLSIKFITRDRGLIEFSKDIIKVNKPEELIS